MDRTGRQRRLYFRQVCFQILEQYILKIHVLHLYVSKTHFQLVIQLEQAVSISV